MIGKELQQKRVAVLVSELLNPDFGLLISDYLIGSRSVSVFAIEANS